MTDANKAAQMPDRIYATMYEDGDTGREHTIWFDKDPCPIIATEYTRADLTKPVMTPCMKEELDIPQCLRTTPAANTGDEPLGYLAQYPDGSGVFYQSKQQAEAHAQKAFTKCVSIPIYAALQRPEPSEGMPYGIIDPDYARVFSMARCLAWSEGYALLFHGSFTRDLDLIAIPWTDRAKEPEHLVWRIVAAADLECLDETPKEKEHGRLAWTMVFKGFGDPRFIDFSVMQPALAPRQVDVEAMTFELVKAWGGNGLESRSHTEAYEQGIRDTLAEMHQRNLLTAAQKGEE